MTSVGKRPPSQILQIPIPAIRTPFVTQIRMRVMQQEAKRVVANSNFISDSQSPEIRQILISAGHRLRHHQCVEMTTYRPFVSASTRGSRDNHI